MKTHRLVAHIEADVSCMFCDLRGVTADEMTYHINTAHSDDQVAWLTRSSSVSGTVSERHNGLSSNGRPSHMEPESDVFTRVVCCTALTNDNAAGFYCLSSEEFDTKPFAF